MRTSITLFVALSSAGVLLASPAAAGGVYGPVGFPGAGLGFALPLSPQFGLRIDAASIGQRRDTRHEEGIDYDGRLKADRLRLLADWFPFAGGFRLTGGVTANQYRLDLLASGAGGSLTLGNTRYTTSANDRFAVQLRLPRSTPYFGFGWGHQSGNGLRWSVDVGAMLGKATVSYSLTGPIAQRAAQTDIDVELAELRSGVGRVRAVPQLSLGLGYNF
ncbi:MAG: hypothetical protein LH480_08680 [Rubrivivax sp.]|nr:hypothetical protein [Rubrivivax sp.]